ncbi:MAG: carboxymuconolactone decarboxylase family protein [Bacteroidetes bacterium]|nr:MAG: carboxymuconolactone decarboxylase family protein [Bacteroidota bacterium]
MTKFQVPTREQVTPENQAIFDKLNSQMGFVPNIYATYAFSKDALGRYMSFAGGKTSLNAKEKEVINLIVSQVNGCTYCLAAHTAVGKMTGFTDEQILELRKGTASFDTKFEALVKLAKSIIVNRGSVDDATLEAFFNAGYDKGNLVDVILAVGEKSITNFLHKVTDIPIDFPEAPGLS